MAAKPQSKSQEKPRLNSQAVAALVHMHRNHGGVPPRLGMGRAALFNAGLVTYSERGWVLSLEGKQLARHLTGVK